MKLLRHVQHVTVTRLLDSEAELWGRTEAGGDFGGAFSVMSSSLGRELHVIASNGDGWDHVSVSGERSCPTWEEMEQVKRLFFKQDEVAMQLHVSGKDHINIHPNCLHLWRPHAALIPLPPKEFV